jgi:lambda repressor-like predicted transcriptional regulator
MVRLKVKEVAKREGFSMGKLSRLADVPYNTIRSIYRNPFYSITTITLGRIADALGVDASELVESDPPPPQKITDDKDHPQLVQ